MSLWTPKLLHCALEGDPPVGGVVVVVVVVLVVAVVVVVVGVSVVISFSCICSWRWSCLLSCSEITNQTATQKQKI